MSLKSDQFSKIGFVLAMAGSAVGLGNAWKFPTMVGNNGGSAFIVLYLVLTFCIAFVAFLGEAAIGKLGQSDMVNSIFKLAPRYKKQWSLAGFFMLGAVIIASFYMIVIGWILYYALISLTSLPATSTESGVLFGDLISNNLKSVFLCYTFVFFTVFYIVSRGIKNGIEKLNIWMMPSLFILLVLMLIYSATFGDGFTAAAKFLFVPDFSKINAELVLQALGLAFFSLSMGVGAVPTYAASLPDGTNLIKSTLSIIFINICIGLMMGLVVFTFIFTYGADTTQTGPGLIFVSLTTLFAKLGIIGNILAVCFFISLLFAGITSAISMIEPFTFYLINKFNFSRKKALILIGIFTYILSIACVLSFYAPTANTFSFFGKSVFDILDYLTSNIIMPIGAIIFSFFVGFVIKKDEVFSLLGQFLGNTGFCLWYFAIRFIVPISILAIAIYQILGA